MTQHTNIRKRRWWIGALVAAGLIVAGLVWGYRWSEEANSNRYACYEVADLLVYYMETHDGEWPKGWEDLRGMYEGYRWKRFGGKLRPLDQIERQVEIDFQFRPKAFPNPDPDSENWPRVVWARNGRDVGGARYAGRLVMDYLKNPSKFSVVTEPTTQP